MPPLTEVEEYEVAAPRVDELRKSIPTVSIGGQVIGGDSVQPDDIDYPGWGMPQDGIMPPVALHILAGLSGINSTRRAIVEAMARNTVGLGLDATPNPRIGVPPERNAEKAGELLNTLDALSMRDVRMERPTFTEHMVMVKTDEEECGQGALEVSRNKITGRIDGLFYVPGKRVRRKSDRSGYYLLAPNGDVNSAVEFVNFGERVEYTEEGEPTSNFRSDLNELLVFRLFTTENRDYGMPRDLGLLADYYADKLAAEANIGFFDASGVPPTLVFVGTETPNKGEQLSGQTVKVKLNQNLVQAMGRTLSSDAGRQHRVAILPLPPGGKVQDVQLGKVNEKDVGYVNFRQDFQNRQLAAFRLSPVFITGNLAQREDAEVQRSLTLEQVFDPEQARYEGRLNRLLLTELGYADMALRFKRLAIESDMARRSGADSMATVGVITNREFRDAHGYNALPEVQIGDELLDGREVVDDDEAEDVNDPPLDDPAPVDPPPPTDPNLPDPTPDPAPAPTPEPAPTPTTVALSKVTPDEAGQIGKVPPGWNDALVKPTQMSARPSEKTPNQPDNRGQRAGIGGRGLAVRPEKNPAGPGNPEGVPPGNSGA